MEFCRDAESMGAGALWAIDHLFWPQPLLECLIALTVAAAATERVPIGSCVLQLPLRHAESVAKQAATLQVLSGGRMVLGLGVGLHRGEYEAAGMEFTTRGKRLDRGIAALHRSWASALDSDRPYRQEPEPLPIPIWIGGTSPAARRRAAVCADGWVPLFLGPEELAPAFGLLQEEADQAGRDPGDVTTAAVVFIHVGPQAEAVRRGTSWLSAMYGIPAKAFERHLIAGPAESCAEQVACYHDAGAEHVVVMVADHHPLDHFSPLVDALGSGALRSAGYPAYRIEPLEVLS